MWKILDNPRYKEKTLFKARRESDFPLMIAYHNHGCSLDKLAIVQFVRDQFGEETCFGQ